MQGCKWRVLNGAQRDNFCVAWCGMDASMKVAQAKTKVMSTT